jgi:hypothetical protein
MAVIELAERLKEYVEDSSAPTSIGTSKREWVIVTSHADQMLAIKPDLCDLHLHTRARKLHEHLSTIHYTKHRCGRGDKGRIADIFEEVFAAVAARFTYC